MLAVNALDVDINGTPILRGIGLDINSGEIIARGTKEELIANKKVREVYLGNMYN